MSAVEAAVKAATLERLAIMAGVLATLAGVLSGLAGTYFLRRKDRREAAANKREEVEADDVISKRIIELVEIEADKRIRVAEATFNLQFANLKLEHARELTGLRRNFEEQLAEIRRERQKYHCENAIACNERVEPGGVATKVRVAPAQ